MSSNEHRCNFSDHRLNFSCKRTIHTGNHCYFHSPLNPGKVPKDYAEELRSLLANNDGDWRAFILPQELRLSNVTIPCHLDARGIQAGSLAFAKATFEDFTDFEGATFGGDLAFDNCHFKGEGRFADLDVAGRFRWNSVAHKNAVFGEANFRNPATFLGEFQGVAKFNRVIFHDAVEFVGGWNYTLAIGEADNPPPNRRYLFYGDVHFEFVDFRRPNRSRFHLVDLRRAFVSDTDFRGVAFYGIEWEQDSLGRRGLYDEVWARDKKIFAQNLPRIGTAYRNLRVAHEESKDFQSATDFYVGELEARRLELPKWKQWVGLENLYRLLSNYGASPTRASIWLGVFLTVHMLAAWLANDAACFEKLSSCRVDWDLIVNSGRLLTVLRAPNFEPLPAAWGLIDIVVQILIVIQIALLVLALRGRIKRG